MKNSGSNNLGIILTLAIFAIFLNPKEERHIEAITFETSNTPIFFYEKSEDTLDWEYIDYYIFSVGKLDNKIVSKGYLGKVVRVY